MIHDIFICRTFAGTKSAAADPLKAAKVYENIADAIDEAERAAKKAKKDAYNATNIVSYRDTYLECVAWGTNEPRLEKTCLRGFQPG